MFSGQQAWYFDYGNAQEDWQKTNKVSAPKLRASAGETRSLIPWSLEIAEALLGKSNTFENTIFQATLQLNACYSLLSRDLWNPQELAIAGQRFLLLYVSLSDSDPEGMFWRFKPKHHLFQELCEFDECCPSQNWTYRDEDMGGTVAAISRRRGGEPCLPFGVCLFFCSPCFILLWFDATWSVASEENTIASTSRNTLYKFMSQHELPQWPVAWRETRNSCQADTSTHLFFVHLFAHALGPRRYSLHLGFFKDIEIKFPERKISTQRKESLLRRCMVSVKEKSPKRRLLPTFLHKVKLSKGQQRKKHMTILAQT